MDKYRRIEERFKKNRNELKAASMSKYMKNKFPFYGISAPERRKLYNEFLKNEQRSGSVDWDFLFQCYENEHREFQYLVYDYLLKMKEFIVYEDIPKIRKLIITKSWWDTIDFLAQVIGNIAIRDERTHKLMLEWSGEENIWIKRTAIEYQLRLKEKTDPSNLKFIILNCLNTDEFFINKAIGWALREYSKTNREWVINFMQEQQDKMNVLSVKEASKYL
ncbi:DNA alkylation repair protein [Ligilactobacillus faecis]|uniref:DNA alkylation repair protein n=1 Tax=Ligilactobacillus faecis TaxID=762833 RepID=UPI00246909B9|nr:DNA alkylation repair protein [Ligilactobacillus faecis]WGN88800.1 DNA alkylation repair protein [Ligilactobacillus faecis]